MAVSPTEHDDTDDGTVSGYAAPLQPPSLARPEEPVALLVSGNRAYVHDIDGESFPYVIDWTSILTPATDLERLRMHHHICGTLVGTLPHVAQQNLFLGLPLHLSPEEVACLLKHGLAVLVPCEGSHFAPTTQQVEEYARGRVEDSKKAQVESATAEAERREHFMKIKADEIARKRREKGKAVDKSADRATATTIEEAAAKQSFPIVTASTSRGLPWYDEMVTFSSLSAAYKAKVYVQPPPLLTIPAAARANARMAVFEDLWRRGFYLGSGLKFGADFLAYPGDPLRFHSHFACTVLVASQTTTPPSSAGEGEVPPATPHEQSLDSGNLDPINLVSWGRLATAVKKSHLLAEWNQRTGQIKYLSLEWAGFG